MFKKESMNEMMRSCCGDTAEEDCKKMMDRCSQMMKQGSQGKEGGKHGMKEFSSCCASFMKHCCVPMAEGNAKEPDGAHRE